MANGTVNRGALLFIPPGGFDGFAQQTPATKALLRSGNGPKRGGGARRKRGKKKAAKRRPARARRAKSRASKVRLVKGSAAARRHMAKLRKMRKR